MRRALPAIALLAALTAVAALPTAAAQSDAPCGDGSLPEVSAFAYEAGGAEMDALPANLSAGTEVTVHFLLEGCGERTMAFAAYSAEAGFRLEDQVLFNASADLFAAGEGALTIQVPPCLFQIDFVYGGDVILQFDTASGIDYHDQGRFIDGVQGGEPCGGGTNTTTSSSPPSPTSSSAPPPPPSGPSCPTGVKATANANGSVTLAFAAAAGANATLVYRSEGAGNLTLLATLPGDATGYLDATAKAGTAYRYVVTAAFDGGVQAQGCAAVEVSSIPEFPTALATGLAVGCGLLAYAAVRRRRA